MTFADLRDRHAGQRAYIIGKGPSLDTVERIKDSLNAGVVFCLNQSIRKVEPLVFAPLYVIQHDWNLGDLCCPVQDSTVHLVGYDAQHPLPRSPGPIIKYSPSSFATYGSTLSGIDAVYIAKHMGIGSATFVAFDAWLKEPRLDYAGCIDPIVGDEQRQGQRHVGNGAEIRREANTALDSWNTLHPNSGHAKTH